VSEPRADGRPAITDALVVKLGGTTIAEERAVLGEIAVLRHERPVVVVHGGGKRLTEWLARLGVESRFEAGLRVTDDAALEVALAVLGGVVNGELVAALRSLGADAVGLRGLDGGTLRGSRVPGLGRVVGEPRAEPALLGQLIADGRLPVVAPIGLDDDGVICNINADDAAAAICASLGGELLLLTDVDGVRGADGKRIPELTPARAEGLIAEGVIVGGMIPKVRSALRALGTGSAASRAIVADGRAPNALRQALYGAGTSFRTVV
jgi:acetylglutamate kinase